jgi:hypothetical protein
MAEDTTKGESRPDSVLGSLPSTRPQRLTKPRAKAAKKVARPAAKKVAQRTPKKPVAVSAGCPELERKTGSEPPPRPLPPPRGTELVTTTIRAGGELARIGLSVGGRVLKRAVEKLPRP